MEKLKNESLSRRDSMSTPSEIEVVNLNRNLKSNPLPEVNVNIPSGILPNSQLSENPEEEQGNDEETTNQSDCGECCPGVKKRKKQLKVLKRKEGLRQRRIKRLFIKKVKNK